MAERRCRTCGCGTSTARPRSRRWPPCSSPRTSCASPARPAAPALNVETRVVDDAMHDVRPGEVGEIVHRSPQLLLGYFNDDERTAAAFEGGWFHRGDLATIDDEGYITVVDRKKDMIKTGGENVASREVEEAIYRLDGVSRGGGDRPAASALDRGGDRRDRGQGRATRSTRQRVLAHAAQHLAGFKVPEGGGVRRRAAEEPERQAAQARAAAALRGLDRVAVARPRNATAGGRHWPSRTVPASRSPGARGRPNGPARCGECRVADARRCRVPEGHRRRLRSET